jgi:hypothetical protein
MIEIDPNLYVGAQSDEDLVRGGSEWFIIHACKEPYHRDALGYTGKAAPKDHPEYLIARRPRRLVLNLVDAPNVAYIPREIIDTALDAIHEEIGTSKILVHCNQGMSRSPTIAFLYLAKFTEKFTGLGIQDATAAFKKLYPPYNPAQGMADYVRINWSHYQS